MSKPKAATDDVKNKTEISGGSGIPFRALILVSIVFIVLAGCFNAVSPLRVGPHQGYPANPDEQVHMYYVQQLSSGTLPVFSPGGANYEAHQPPLYYALCAPVFIATHAFVDERQAKAVRCVSTLLGVALIWVTFFAVRVLFPERHDVPLMAAMFAAFVPMNVSLAASVSNDSLTNLVMALGLWQIARIAVALENWAVGGTWAKQAALLGVIMAAGIYTKTSTLLLFAVTVIVFGYLAVNQPTLRKTAVASMLVACATGLLLGAPWLARNTMLYGDPVAQHIFMTAFKNTAHPSQVMSSFQCTQLWQLWVYVTIPLTFYSFWGVFVSMSLILPGTIYAVMLGFSVASVVGWILWLRRTWGSLETSRRAILWGYWALIALSIAALVRFNLVFFQAQGRYLYTALIPIAALFVLGLRQLEPEQYRNKLVGFFFAILLLMDVASIVLVSHHFNLAMSVDVR